MKDTLSDLLARIDDLEAGLFRAPVGPGTIRGKAIAPKQITSGLIKVSDLESVQTRTGSLSVTGGITLTNAGTISAGQTAYDTGVGYWLDNAGGTPRFSLGNSGGSKLTWNGTALAITGTITADSGRIGGWTISSTDLQGSGGVIGLASSGSIRIWSGSATPSAAPFQVDSLGNLTATAGAIGGWTIDSTLGLKLGSGASTRGISTGSVAFYAGSATPSTAPFAVDTAGAAQMSNLTITGGSINLNGGVFSVSSAGAVNCSNITATGGTIGGVNINATSLSSSGWSLTNAGVMTSTSGTVGGLTIGANSLTVPAGKKLKFGASAADYLGDNILHFEVASSQTGKVEFKNGANAPYAALSADASSTLAEIYAQALNGSRSAGLIAGTTAADATTFGQLYASNSVGGVAAGLVAQGDGKLLVQVAGVTGTAQAFPTGASPTSVIMSTDLGTTLLSIGVLAVPMTINGTARKVLVVG